MAVLSIQLYPEPVLTKEAEPVRKIDSDIEKLIEDMGETMYAAQGVGLAAPQVGISKRVIVVSLLQEDQPRRYMAMINPELISTQGDIIAEEGCLSVQGCRANVRRAQRVEVSYLDREGVRRELEAQDILARILQHEIDHLNGILFFERLSRIKRDLIKKRLIKQAKRSNTID
jgi:peptide deformylase